MVGWCFARQERTYAPDRYITFSSASGGERGDGAIEQELVDVDGRLDGRQFESVRRGFANAAIPYPKTVSQWQSVEGAQISVSASERPGASQSHSS